MPIAMHADQIDVPAELVRRLLEEQFPELATLPLEEVDSTGTVNALFRLGPELLVRLPLTPRGNDGVRYEHAWLPWFAGRLPVRVPVLRGAGEPSLGYPCPWSVLEWIDRSVPDAEDLTDPDGLAADLGQLVTAIRRLDRPALPRRTAVNPSGTRTSTCGRLSPRSRPTRSCAKRSMSRR
jgi:aminoglycoside phosphotransferase (APT) family kinase protein